MKIKEQLEFGLKGGLFSNVGKPKMEGGGNNSQVLNTDQNDSWGQPATGGWLVIHASMYAEECPRGIGLDKKMCSPITGGKVQETAKKGKIDIMVSLQSGTFTTLLSCMFFSRRFFSAIN